MSGFGSAVACLSTHGAVAFGVTAGALWLGLLAQLDKAVAMKTFFLVLATVGGGAYVYLTKPHKDDDPWPAIDKPPFVRRPYDFYDLKEPKKSFVGVCERLIEETVAELRTCYEVNETEIEWIENMLKYNVMGGKMNRGLMVVEAGKLLFKELTNDDLNRLAVLGWCVEWLQGWLLVADDFMDASITRRGKPCWYKVEGVEKIAINDAFLIEMLLFKTV